MYNYSRLECHTYCVYICVILPIMNNVTKHTRVKKIDGVDEARRQIFCPTCSALHGVPCNVRIARMILIKPNGSYAIEQETPEKKERKNTHVYMDRNSDW